MKNDRLNQVLNELRVTPDANLRQRTLADARAALTVNRFRCSRWCALAAGVVLVMSLVLWTSQREQTPAPLEVKQSPRAGTSLATLTQAYQRGGLQGLEAACDQGAEEFYASSVSPVQLSMKQWLERIDP